jgi:hypothetical protein
MKRKLTAKEHGEMLDKDPKYQAMMAEKRRQWAEQAAVLRKDAEPLVAALTAVGWPTTVQQLGETRSVWDLVNTTEPYPHLLETLADHVTRPYHKRTREGISRALAVREARGTRIPRVLMDELKKETDPKEGLNTYRWALINTLALIGEESLKHDVQQLLTDPRYETVRKDLLRLAKKVHQPSRRGPKGKEIGNETERES